MAISQNTKDLIRFVAKNDYKRAKNAALAVLANDKADGNASFRQEMQHMLLNQDVYGQAEELPYEIRKFVVVEDVSKTFLPERYFLSDREAKCFLTIEDMRKSCTYMDSLQIRYLNSTLLFGLSGTGKTMFGRFVAHSFGLPFIYLNFSQCVDSYLGKTSQNLAGVFDWVRLNECVFMIDELDCISLVRGKSGGGGGAAGELARITITLLQELDRLPNNVVLIAATNRFDRIDSAIVRRFSHQHEVRPLTKDELEECLTQYLVSTGVNFDRDSISIYVDAAMKEPSFNQSRAVTYVNQRIAYAYLNQTSVVL